MLVVSWMETRQDVFVTEDFEEWFKTMVPQLVLVSLTFDPLTDYYILMSTFFPSVTFKCQCLDVDECSSGRHRCHREAECINLEGSYRCNCRNGFSGDGYYCQQKLTCDELQCDVNGECSISEITRGPECRCR